MSACVPGGRPAGSDQDTHASISRVDTGTAQCSEEADHTHDDLELPSAEAVLEIVLLPVDDIPSERRALRQSSRNRAKAFLEAIGQMALPPRPGAVTSEGGREVVADRPDYQERPARHAIARLRRLSPG